MRFVTCILLGFCFYSEWVKELGGSDNYTITQKNLKNHVSFLCSEKLEGRLTGTNGEKLAADYIATVFRNAGLEPAGDNGTFFQDFDFTVDASIGKKYKQRGRNVLAKLKVGQAASTIMIIGAHADHLGHGEVSGSRARANEKGMIHAGADDNASGVASVLETAISLSKLNAQGKLKGNKDIVFAIWSGEELGLLGSSHFVKELKKTMKTQSLHPALDANINLDMVGRLRENLVIQGVGSSSRWPAIIKQVNKTHPIPLITQNDPYLPTDSTTFYLQGIPTLNLFSGSHDEYHTARDTPETLNYTGIQRISGFLVNMILALETEPTALAYQEVKKTRGQSGRGYRVYFGTIPDYASADISGVKLSGVTKDSPADHAGARQDDVIIELAGKKIHDIYAYTNVLSGLHPGKPVKMVVLRGQEKIALMIVGRSREAT